MTGPKRRTNDHVHPEYWGREDHNRFEDRVTAELISLEKAVEGLKSRLTLLLGALMLVAFLLPIAAPWVRDWIGVPTPPVPIETPAPVEAPE